MDSLSIHNNANAVLARWALVALVATVMMLSPCATEANTFTINNSGDGGDANPGNGVCETAPGNGVCTLRAAIMEVNALAAGAPHTIAFAIGSGTVTIAPLTALPVVSRARTVIDGTTQPGYAGTPIVEVNGAGAGALVSGFTLTGGGSTLRGLVINRFSYSGVQLGSDSNTVSACYIGTNVAGTGALPNVATGVSVTGASNTVQGNLISGNTSSGVAIFGAGATLNNVWGNTIGADVGGSVALPNNFYGVAVGQGAASNAIGGTGSGQGNVISGNASTGVYLVGTGTNQNTVAGNLIGTDSTGTAKIPNGGLGVVIDTGAQNNVIGGSQAGARNIISGNAAGGVQINGTAQSVTTANLVAGNYIGADATGGEPLGNGGSGVMIIDSPANTIGGATAATANVIAANSSGITVLGLQATGNTIQGNFIGTNATRNGMLGNKGDGVLISGGVGTSVGGTVAGVGNVIANNGGAGVALALNVAPCTGHGILGNSIYANGQLGIDLIDKTGRGVTPNDHCDLDSTAAGDGPNNLQNFPVLTSAVVMASQITILGTLDSNASVSGYRIEFFASQGCDPSGYGEGQIYLGSATANTDANCNASFSATLPVSIPAGSAITATATDPDNNTSEFSACSTAVAPIPPTITKAFGMATVPLNGTTSLTLNLTNPNPTAGLTGVGFTDTLPVGLIITTPNGLATTCGGTTTATAGSSSITVSGVSLAADSSCTVAVNVTGITAGSWLNTTSTVTSVEAGPGNPASATLSVLALIPTLGGWGLLALAALLGVAALLVLRRSSL